MIRTGTKGTILPSDLDDLEDMVYAFYRQHESLLAVRLAEKVLRWRGETGVFACDVDESGGMAEVVELSGYSRKAPCV